MPEQTLDPKRDRMGLDLDTASLSIQGADTRGRTGSDTRPADPLQQLSGNGSNGAGYGPAFAGDEVHLVDYLRILHKRRWTAATAFLIVFGSVTIYSFTATPIFSARAQILIENENPN